VKPDVLQPALPPVVRRACSKAVYHAVPKELLEGLPRSCQSVEGFRLASFGDSLHFRATAKSKQHIHVFAEDSLSNCIGSDL
jgi:hypothetical protein